MTEEYDQDNAMDVEDGVEEENVDEVSHTPLNNPFPFRPIPHIRYSLLN